MGKIEEKDLDTIDVSDGILSNQDYLHKILQITSDTLIVLDSQNICVDLLLKSESPIFTSKEYVVGRNFLELMPTETALLVKKELEYTRQTGEASNVNYDLFVHNNMYYFKLIVHKFDDEHLLCQYRDITQRGNMKNRLKNNATVLMEVGKQAKIALWSYDFVTGCTSYFGFSSFEDEVLIEPRAIPFDEYLLVIHEDDRELVSKFVFDESYEGKTIEYRIVGGNGPMQYLRCTRYISVGDPNRVSGFTQNVTDFIRNRHELEMIDSVVYNSSSSIIAARSDGTVIFMNKLSRVIANIEENKPLAGINVKDLIDELSIDNKWESLIDRLKNSKESLRFRIKNVCVERGVLELECVASVIKNWEGEDIIWLSQEDISDRIRYEEQLLKSKESAEESEKLKMAFISNMNHEIRTPLGAIVGLSMLIADEDNAELRKEYSKLVTSNSDQLLRLVSDVLEMSKLDSGNMMTYKTESLHAIMQDLDLSFRHEEKLARLQISIPKDDVLAYLDKGRLMQLLTNMINNSRKFTDPLGLIEVGYEVVNGMIEFFVKDNGIGIPADKQEHVFNRFYKVNESDQGTGLGLAICKSIVEQMNGKIDLESEEGKGTIFRISIPLIIENED